MQQLQTTHTMNKLVLRLSNCVTDDIVKCVNVRCRDMSCGCASASMSFVNYATNEICSSIAKCLRVTTRVVPIISQNEMEHENEQSSCCNCNNYCKMGGKKWIAFVMCFVCRILFNFNHTQINDRYNVFFFALA